MSAPQIIAFDIETGALPIERIREVAPPFDRDAVATGNMGLEKSMEKINSQERLHFDKIEDKAALHAEYGQTLAIGYATRGEDPVLLLGDEAEMIATFWERIAHAFERGDWRELWVGHKSNSFDLPFLYRRSMILLVKPPRGLIDRGRYWHPVFADTMEIWAAGEFKKFIGLDRLCRVCGLPGKNGSGKFFSTLLEEDEAAALDYLRNDLEITLALGERILPVSHRHLWIKAGSAKGAKQ